MIEFFVISSERSGSTWAANWLTTGKTLCLHDPLMRYTLRDLELLSVPGRRLGVACTGLALYPEWVNAQPGPKLVLERPRAEVAASLKRAGVGLDMSHVWPENLDKVKGLHAPWHWMFDPIWARAQWDHLMNWTEPFDALRHEELVQMNVQPQWNRVAFQPAAIGELSVRIQRAMLGE